MRFFEKSNLDRQNRCFDKSTNDFKINYKLENSNNKGKLNFATIARNSENKSSNIRNSQVD